VPRNDHTWPPDGYDPSRGSGYRLTREQFSQLTSGAKYRPFVAPLLRRWFGIELVDVDSGTTFRAADHAVVDAGTVYASVQSDPKKQYELYQFAMSWWR
jgi:hypothetical protein